MCQDGRRTITDEEIEMNLLKEFIDKPSNLCPSCGRCPHCGRVDTPVFPNYVEPFSINREDTMNDNIKECSINKECCK